MALQRARRFLRRVKHQPFLAIVIDEGRDKVHVYHTTGIDHEKIAAMRLMLDELEARLGDVGSDHPLGD